MTKRKSKGFCLSYIGSREDIQQLIPKGVKRILDIGCATGELGRKLKESSKELEVIGVEKDRRMAEEAKKKLDRVIIGDIEKIKLQDFFAPGYFDCIIFADVLEHLREPWNILRESVKLLATGGIVVASIPNVRHYTTLFTLVIGGYWPYRERGIHDLSHLRFFALRNIQEMFIGAGLKIKRIKRNYRIFEQGHRYNKFSKFFALPPFRELLTFQYLIVAEKPKKYD